MHLCSLLLDQKGKHKVIIVSGRLVHIYISMGENQFDMCCVHDCGSVAFVMNVSLLKIGMKDGAINKLLIRLGCNCFIDTALMDMTRRCKQI